MLRRITVRATMNAARFQARLCATVDAARFQAQLYAHGARPLSAIPADLGHAWRGARTAGLYRASEAIATIVEFSMDAHCAVYNAWVLSGRDREDRLGIPEPEQFFSYSSGMHTTYEPCPDDVEAD